MDVIIIILCEYTDWELSKKGGVRIHDEDAVVETTLGVVLCPEDAARSIAKLVRERPPVNDGWEDGAKEVAPISHFTLSAIRLGAPLSEGQKWWLHLKETDSEEEILESIQEASKAPCRSRLVWKGELDGDIVRVRRPDEHNLIVERRASNDPDDWVATDDETAMHAYEKTVLELFGGSL